MTTLSMLASAAFLGAQAGLPGPARLELAAQKAVDAALAQFKDQKLAADQIGIAISSLDRTTRTYAMGAYRGAEEMYPASVVKLFFLAYAANELERGRLRLTKELERGIRDMIVESNNDATGLVLDSITGTTGGPELSPRALAQWMERRQAVNRWYRGLGYDRVNASQKTWNEGPYGRERQGYGPNFERRNSLTPVACARLMSEILLDRVVSPARCEWMRGYLARAIPADGPVEDFQAKSFTGRVLPKGTKLWSKAGWTSTVTHDVAGFRLPDGREFVFAIFTKGQSDNKELVPFLAGRLLVELGAASGERS